MHPSSLAFLRQPPCIAPFGGTPDWAGLKRELNNADWRWVESEFPSEGARRFGKLLQVILERHIPCEVLHEHVQPHPWLSDRCRDAVVSKRRAHGTAQQRETADLCSAVLLEEFRTYIKKTRERIKVLRPASKEYWRLAKRLLGRPETVEGIPALQFANGSWAMDSKSKADLLADTFCAKWVLPAVCPNRFSEVANFSDARASNFHLIRSRSAACVLSKLRADSASGPDGVSARVFEGKCFLLHLLPIPAADKVSSTCIVKSNQLCNIWE